MKTIFWSITIITISTLSAFGHNTREIQNGSSKHAGDVTIQDIENGWTSPGRVNSSDHIHFHRDGGYSAWSPCAARAYSSFSHTYSDSKLEKCEEEREKKKEEEEKATQPDPTPTTPTRFSPLDLSWHYQDDNLAWFTVWLRNREGDPLNALNAQDTRQTQNVTITVTTVEGRGAYLNRNEGTTTTVGVGARALGQLFTLTFHGSGTYRVDASVTIRHGEFGGETFTDSVTINHTHRRQTTQYNLNISVSRSGGEHAVSVSVRTGTGRYIRNQKVHLEASRGLSWYGSVGNPSVGESYHTITDNTGVGGLLVLRLNWGRNNTEYTITGTTTVGGLEVSNSVTFRWASSGTTVTSSDPDDTTQDPRPQHPKDPKMSTEMGLSTTRI